MFVDFCENWGLTIPFIVTMVLMLIVSIYIIVMDFKKMSIKVWALLLLPTISFIGVIVARICGGCFQWYFLLYIPIYVILDFINVKFNKNKIIGQGDVDIFAGSIAMLSVLTIGIFSNPVNIPEMYDDGSLSGDVSMIHFQSLMLESLIFLLLGYVIVIVIHFGSWLFKKYIMKDYALTLKGRKVPVALAYIPLLFYTTYAGVFLAF